MDKQSLADLIREAGFRATKPRLLLLEHLRVTKSPQSILEIAEALSDSIDQVTTYRIVEAFKKAGLVREIDLRQGRPLYEIMDSHDHHHVVCVNCDRVEDFTGCESEKLANRALQQTKGFALINSHSLEFFGLCKSCVKQDGTLQTA
jgi:Fur family transcriptional regulator, ferric uptake regulator